MPVEMPVSGRPERVVGRFAAAPYCRRLRPANVERSAWSKQDQRQWSRVRAGGFDEERPCQALFLELRPGLGEDVQSSGPRERVSGLLDDVIGAGDRSGDLLRMCDLRPCRRHQSLVGRGVGVEAGLQSITFGNDGVDGCVDVDCSCGGDVFACEDFGAVAQYDVSAPDQGDDGVGVVRFDYPCSGEAG